MSLLSAIIQYNVQSGLRVVTAFILLVMLSSGQTAVAKANCLVTLLVQKGIIVECLSSRRNIS
ncbi:hypothetical protein [Streptococcus acidominimus]|uniref:hypothetical protein n=1 Tax=Streptococcus acidominimus TaxID=1326 RepID=UPI000AA23097|nr:hypothetical protein [Streptococcus acidominimus]